MVNRTRQRDILPLAVKFRLSEFYDPSDNTYKFRDNNGVPVFTIDPNDGTISFGSSVIFDTNLTFTGDNTFAGASTFTGAVTKGVSVASFVKEMKIFLLSGGSSSGGSGSYFTDSTSMVNLNVSEFIIDPDDYPDATFLLEAICRAGANGDSLRTLTIELYDVTGSATVSNSTMSTTTTEAAAGPGSLVRLRGSTNFRGNLTSGDRTYITRYKSDTSSRFVDVHSISLIIRF